MLYFFAKLGQKPWAKNVIPAVNFAACAGYLIYHHVGHNLVRNLLVAEQEDGRRQIISDELKNLIIQVYTDVQPHLKERADNHRKRTTNPPINWFCSSTTEPVSIGATWLVWGKGSQIGLPERYNYDKVQDLPESFFVLRKLKLFKRPTKESTQEDAPPLDESLEDEIKSEVETEHQSNLELTTIDKYNPDAKNYSDALILSENAKKFSIAREIFACDNYRIFFFYTIYALSSALAVSISRAAVMKMNLQTKNLSKRLPVYALGGLAGYVNMRMLSVGCEFFYQLDSDDRALSLGSAYKEGAIEYYTKILKRNKALKELSPKNKFKFDEDGEPIRSLLMNIIGLSYKKLLENAQNYQVSTEK